MDKTTKKWSIQVVYTPAQSFTYKIWFGYLKQSKLFLSVYYLYFWTLRVMEINPNYVLISSVKDTIPVGSSCVLCATILGEIKGRNIPAISKHERWTWVYYTDSYSKLLIRINPRSQRIRATKVRFPSFSMTTPTKATQANSSQIEQQCLYLKIIKMLTNLLLR